ncbi:MAG: hypothetical protein CVV44_06825 [Spirochaetae bacterium HGW-Spirochaetae-1]|nr:MAG: hypothetical protein CVV44_06825 [Spirochaetae bacterium HGW-Spirochaetae-1]
MKKPVNALLCLCLLVMLSGCDGNEGGSSDVNYQVVWVTDDIDTPTTWTFGNIYVIYTYPFYINDVLTLEPGVIVKFHPDGDYAVLYSGGKIDARGTASRPIVFTSFRDDEHGGDTNGDGPSWAAKGDWMRIDTNGQPGSVFRHCAFYYGGASTYYSTLRLYHAVPESSTPDSVTDCVFAHNRGGTSSGYFYGALDATYAAAGSVITGNRFYDNIFPLSIGPYYSIDDSNMFSDAAGSINNDCNGIFYNANEDFRWDISWSETEVAFAINDNLWITGNTDFTLGSNVVVKFYPSSILNIDSDGSSLVNYTSPSVQFTSYRDDSRKGDTNGDGPSSGTNNDWGGIYLDASSTWYSPPDSNVFYDSH